MKATVSLSVLALLLLALPAAGQAYDWSNVGSVGITQAGSGHIFTGPTFTFSASRTGTLIARYNVTNTYGAGVSKTPPWTTFSAAFTDNSSLGVVNLRLMQVDKCSNAESQICCHLELRRRRSCDSDVRLEHVRLRQQLLLRRRQDHALVDVRHRGPALGGHQLRREGDHHENTSLACSHWPCSWPRCPYSRRRMTGRRSASAAASTRTARSRSPSPGPTLKFNSISTGDIVARYPVTNTYGSGTSKTPAWTTLWSTYKDNSSSGSVTTKLLRGRGVLRHRDADLHDHELGQLVEPVQHLHVQLEHVRFRQQHVLGGSDPQPQRHLGSGGDSLGRRELEFRSFLGFLGVPRQVLRRGTRGTVSVARELVRLFEQVKCPVGLMLGSAEADPAFESEEPIFLGRWQGLWEMWETRRHLPAFSKSCGKARLHRGFPQDVSFHSPVPSFMRRGLILEWVTSNRPAAS